jgi:hypothetical protein
LADEEKDRELKAAKQHLGAVNIRFTMPLQTKQYSDNAIEDIIKQLRSLRAAGAAMGQKGLPHSLMPQP